MYRTDNHSSSMQFSRYFQRSSSYCNTKMSNGDNKIVSVKINYHKFEDSTLYRLKKKTILRVVPSESLLGKRIAIQTNYPSNESNDFIRKKFVCLEWFSRYGDKLSTHDNFVEIKDLEMYCQVQMLRSGTFRFYILEEER